MADTIFITGASGHLGGLVVKHLLARGVAPENIVAGSRSPEKLADLKARGVTVRKADFDDAASLKASFHGVDTVLIVSTDQLVGEGARLKQHLTAVEAAVAAGVKRVAYTSLPDPTHSPISFAPDHAKTEQAIQASGLPSTIFRNGWYHENLFMSLPNALQRGQWFTATDGGKVTYASRDEMAEAIAAALANPPAGNVVHTLTGTQAYSAEDIAALVREATGRPLEVVNVSDQQFAEGLAAAGIPPAFVTVLVSIDAATRSGSLGVVTGDLEKLIGRPSTPVTEFIARNADALVNAKH